MEEDNEFDPHAEKTLFNVKQASIREIPDLFSPNILSLRIMHSPDLISMQGIEQFCQLKHLNLSQNSLQSMNLKSLSILETLNLQSNRIKVINCEGMRALKVLNLSYNVIQSLQPLQMFSQQGYQLQQLDLRSNSIADLHQLDYLENIPLQSILFNSDRRKNPICNDIHLYYKAIVNHQVKTVDKLTKSEIKQLLNDENAGVTFKVIKQPAIKQPEYSIEREAEQRVEVMSLQQKVKELTQQNKEIIYKFECNEKYWSSKCSNLEMEIVEQNKFNQELNQENKRFRREIEQLNEQSEYDRKQQKDLVNKKERKDELITQLQNKVSELLQLNGQLSKENQIFVEQNRANSLKEQENQNKLQEAKTQLKEAEKQLSEFHKNAVDQASQTLMKQEQLQQKSEQVNQENRQLYQENSQLKRRIQELLEICREWEVKFESTLRDNEQQVQLQIQQIMHDNEQKLQQQQNKYEQQLEEIETESKLMQDHLENEFRSIYQENLVFINLQYQDKFKLLKSAYDEKVKIEAEQDQTIKILQNRVQEQDSFINELQQALLRLKREVQEYGQEKELSKKEHQIIQHGWQKDFNSIQEELLSTQSKLQQLERDIRLKNEDATSLSQENDRLKGQLKTKIQNEQLLEELQMSLTIKNKMLDDKNDTIDELKQQLNQLKNQEGNASDDYTKLQKRYERQNQVIDELEGQLQQVQDEYDQKCKDLKDKKQLIATFEKEIEEIEMKQDREINGLKQEMQEKEAQLQEMVRLLHDAKEEMMKKDERMRELLVQYQGLEKQISIMDRQNEQSVKSREKQIQELRLQLNQTQDELSMLHEENEKIKRTARENLQNLHKLFQQ